MFQRCATGRQHAWMTAATRRWRIGATYPTVKLTVEPMLALMQQEQAGGRQAERNSGGSVNDS